MLCWLVPVLLAAPCLGLRCLVGRHRLLECGPGYDSCVRFQVNPRSLPVLCHPLLAAVPGRGRPGVELLPGPPGQCRVSAGCVVQGVQVLSGPVGREGGLALQMGDCAHGGQVLHCAGLLTVSYTVLHRWTWAGARWR